ncbi:MAG: hypothetical protein REI94_02290 [Moraxellaceae bacterium]|nr:hypothetical protein [Moraxellaceae bacterium]
MYQYRITKYDPDLRDASGHYPADAWTSRSDIGRSFGGVHLTEEDYLRVEQAYLDAASAFLAEAGIDTLTIRDLENHGRAAHAPREGSRIRAEDVPEVVRSLLREDFWCRLEAASAFIHVGYDYYMYIGTPVEAGAAVAVAQSNGLFVETFASPYATNET